MTVSVSCCRRQAEIELVLIFKGCMGERQGSGRASVGGCALKGDTHGPDLQVKTRCDVSLLIANSF